MITREQMVDGSYSTVYDAVAALRSNWLRARGPDSFVLPSIVWVYIDGARAGDVEVLHEHPAEAGERGALLRRPDRHRPMGRRQRVGGDPRLDVDRRRGGIPLPDSTRRNDQAGQGFELEALTGGRSPSNGAATC